uniref:Uncharacterized protein n=1 Tax=Anguilla anguilla TaxID=7936 RepID=A0A0E9VAL5_ANGAN
MLYLSKGCQITALGTFIVIFVSHTKK